MRKTDAHFMLRDMKLHNLRNSVAKRLVSDASVRSKYIRGVKQERRAYLQRTHTWEKPYYWPMYISPPSYARFMCAASFINEAPGQAQRLSKKKKK